MVDGYDGCVAVGYYTQPPVEGMTTAVWTLGHEAKLPAVAARHALTRTRWRVKLSTRCRMHHLRRLEAWPGSGSRKGDLFQQKLRSARTTWLVLLLHWRSLMPSTLESRKTRVRQLSRS